MLINIQMDFAAYLTIVPEKHKPLGQKLYIMARDCMFFLLMQPEEV